MGSEPKVEDQPEIEDHKSGFDNAPEQRSDQSEAEVEKTEVELSSLDGSAAGTLARDEYKSRHATQGQSLFIPRAMAEKGGDDLPPLTLTDESTHEVVSKPEPNGAKPSQKADTSIQNAWDDFRTKHWNAGVRPVAKIIAMARAEGIEVPALGEPDTTKPPSRLAADLEAERDAIIEYEGRMSRSEAETLAAPSGLARNDTQRDDMLADFW